MSRRGPTARRRCDRTLRRLKVVRRFATPRPRPTRRPRCGSPSASGATEPVDVNKIVRAVSPLLRRADRRRPDARRDARRSAASTTARRRASSTASPSRPPRRSSPKSRNTPSSRRACSRPTSTRRSAGQEIHSFSQSDRRRRTASGSSTSASPSSSPRTRASSTTRSSPSATASSSTSACARSTTATCSSTRRRGSSSRRRSSSSCASPARWRRASPRRSSSIGCSPRSSTCRARRRCSTPGTSHEQLSSCFLLDSPDDHLEAIYKRYTDVALLSKFSGGIGLAYHRVRSRGSLIESTNGHSNGIVPWLKTLDASVAAVNQGGKRKGACCVYLEPWHADIEEFLELRDNTGDAASRTHNLNLANWIPDLFMKRVEADADWCLFDPKAVPHLPDLYGEAFDARLRRGRGRRLAVEDGQGARPLRAHDADARPDRQRLDDLQGQVEPRLQPDGAARANGAPLEPVHRDPRGHVGRGDRRLQPRLDQPRAPHDRRRDGRSLRLREARARPCAPRSGSSIA